MSRFHTTSPAQLEKDLERTVPQKPFTTTVTLTAGGTGTTLSHNAIRPTSNLHFTPTTANARTEGSPAVTAKTLGTATLLHLNAGTTDRTYDVTILNP